MPIDMLILNAGIMALPELEQVNGLEKQFVTNHLGHFIVGNRLLPQVQAAPQGRVVVLTSSGYQWAPEAGIEFDNLSGERDYKPNKMYGQSKLANHLYVRQLAKNLAGSTTTANSVHPGVIMTNLGRSFPQWQQVAARLIGWTFMKSVEAGTATTCYVATAPALATVSGHYFADCNPEVAGRQHGERRAGGEAVGGVGGADAALPACAGRGERDRVSIRWLAHCYAVYPMRISDVERMAMGKSTLTTLGHPRGQPNLSVNGDLSNKGRNWTSTSLPPSNWRWLQRFATSGDLLLVAGPAE